MDLPSTLEDGREMVRLLMESRWLDQATRVVFADVNLYQPYPSKVIMIRMAIEFDISGKVTPSQSIFARTPYLYTDPADRSVLIFESAMTAFFVFHVITEALQLARGGVVAYFTVDPWNVVEWVHMAAFIAAAALHMAGALALHSLPIDSTSSAFVNTQAVVYWMRLEAALLIVNCLVISPYQ